MTVTRPDGVTTILQDGDSIYLIGQGASPEGSRPFLDKLDLKTGEKTRLFHCAEQAFESVARLRGRLALDASSFSHETKTEPPNYFTVDLAVRQADEAHRLPRPRARLTGMKKELIKYQRDDGVPLSGTLYLPPDYKEGTRLPADRLGLPARVQRRRHGRPGAHVSLHVHAVDRPIAVVLRHPGLCGAG